MKLSAQSIEALAPDQASLTAAVKLKASLWPALQCSMTTGFIWGECQGSGATPYRVCVYVADLGYKCTCPSRKFPCKHSLGLMLLFAKSDDLFVESAVPGWVSDWSARRRGPGARTQQPEEESKKSLSAALDTTDKPIDDEAAAIAAARAAKQRERLRDQREASISAGLDELDVWLRDCLRSGIATFLREATQRCRTLAARMVDAKASGLASMIDTLPSQLYALPDKMREQSALEALGSIRLLAEAYRRQAALPAQLRDDVRAMMGWSFERQTLLDDARHTRVNAKWVVLGTFSEVQADKLRRIETWLMGDVVSATLDENHTDRTIPAVLIDYVPVATGSKGSTMMAGEVFDGQLLFYPSAAPLRAIVVEKSIRHTDAPVSPSRAISLNAFLNEYDARRATQPWLSRWPVTLNDVMCSFNGAAELIVHNQQHDDATNILPISRRAFDESAVLAGINIDSLSGLWDGQFFTPMSANTALGVWTLS
jgi:hypothetical protein